MIPLNTEQEFASAVQDYLADPGSEQLLDIEFKEDNNGKQRINAVRFIIQVRINLETGLFYTAQCTVYSMH